MALRPISVKQFIVTIGSESYRFTKASAVTAESNVEEYNDGSTGRTRAHADFDRLSPLELSKPFDPTTDFELITLLKTLKDTAEPVTITKQPVKADYQGNIIEGAKTIIYTGCICISYTDPEVDREGSGMAMVNCTFEVADLSVQ
jgi:hypothetical protein